MRKTQIKRLLILFLLLVNLFNLGFIVYKLKGAGEFQVTVKFILSYFIGLHSVPFFLAALFLFILFLLRRMTKASLLYAFVMLCFVFMTALNFSLFPEILAGFVGQEEFKFQRKEDSTLQKALEASQAQHAETIQAYSDLAELLRGKTIIVPPSHKLHDDIFFIAFVRPKSLIEKDYPSDLNERSLARIRKFPRSRIIAQHQYSGFLMRYIVVKKYPESRIYYLFSYEKRYFFCPDEAKDLILRLQ